jgi:hypothetical protein
MNLFENQLSEVCCSREFYLFFYLLELLKISFLVGTEVILDGIRAYDSPDIKLFDFLRGGILFRWELRRYGLWFLITTKSLMESLLSIPDETDIQGSSSLNLFLSLL